MAYIIRGPSTPGDDSSRIIQTTGSREKQEPDESAKVSSRLKPCRRPQSPRSSSFGREDTTSTMDWESSSWILILLPWTLLSINHHSGPQHHKSTSPRISNASPSSSPDFLFESTKISPVLLGTRSPRLAVNIGPESLSSALKPTPWTIAQPLQASACSGRATRVRRECIDSTREICHLRLQIPGHVVSSAISGRM